MGVVDIVEKSFFVVLDVENLAYIGAEKVGIGDSACDTNLVSSSIVGDDGNGNEII
jgi:hypothetical protein